MREFNLQQYKNRKKELGYSFEELSRLSGVPLGTIQKIFTGETKNPRKQTLERLDSVLFPRQTIYDAAFSQTESGNACGTVGEPALAYGSAQKRQGEYTLEDYLAWPEDQRIELIDGVIYDMSAPVFVHQMLVGEIYYRLKEYIDRQKGACIPFASPVDVQLDCDDKTVVQPDVGVLCDRDKLKNGRIFGAPDFLAEVISPSTRRKDMTLKLQKYQNAGVREYWMVDLYRKMVVTYFFEAEDYPVIYGFSDQIPVRIYDGALSIDTRLMQEWIEEEDWK